MQRVIEGKTRRHAAHRKALRARKDNGPQDTRPATTQQADPYSLRMRNPPNPVDRREVWATYVRKLREATGISRPELARRLAVDPATVWRWETRKQKPEAPDIPQAIARLFGLDVEEVLAAAGLKAGAEPPPAPTPEIVDREIEMVRNDPDLEPEMKVLIVDLIVERRVRERVAALAETRRLIDLMKHRQAS